MILAGRNWKVEEKDRTWSLTKIAAEVAKLLLPCPFCNGPAHYYRAVNGTSAHHCGCGRCGVEFEAQEVCHPDPARDHLTKDIALEWNKRATVGNKLLCGTCEEDCCSTFYVEVFFGEVNANAVKHCPLCGKPCVNNPVAGPGDGK